MSSQRAISQGLKGQAITKIDSASLEGREELKITETASIPANREAMPQQRKK